MRARLYLSGSAEFVYELRALLELEGFPVAATYADADGCVAEPTEVPVGDLPCLTVGEWVDYPRVLAFAEGLSADLRKEAFANKKAAPRREAVSVHPKTRTVSCGERAAVLSEREFCLFSRLSEAAGEAVSREELHRELWEGEGSSKEVDVYVCYLRRKLEPVLGAGCIRAVRGVGYRLVAK